MEAIGRGSVFQGKAKYVLQRLIGSGGMSDVYLANVAKQPMDANLPEVVAIKIMETARLSYRREVSVMRSVDHPHIVPILDWGSADGYYFAVMPYYEKGCFFDELSRTQKAPSPERIYQCLEQMLGALVAIHAQGILHLDIKLSNILINDQGEFLLTDFGISRMMFQEGLKRLRGTLLYMSPEQARSENDILDARSDLYSLGASLWFAMKGMDKVRGADSRLMLEERKRKTLAPLSGTTDLRYAKVAKLIDWMLQFSPKKRPGSAAEALTDLYALGKGEPRQGVSHLLGKKIDDTWRKRLEASLSDPFLRTLLSTRTVAFHARLFEAGEYLCREDEQTFDVFLVLHGDIEILRRGQQLHIETREGSVLGEVSALIGKPRTATLRAKGDVVVAILNGSEMEQVIRKMPGLGLRIMKGLAQKLAERDRA